MNKKNFIKLYKEYRTKARENFLTVGLLLIFVALISFELSIIGLLLLGIMISIDLNRFTFFAENDISVKEIKGDE